MGELRIMVGAALDPSFDRVLRSVEGATRRASRTVATESARAAQAQARSAKDGGDALASGMKKGTNAAESAYAEMVAEITGKGRRMMAPGTQAIADFGKEARQNFRSVMNDFAVTGRNIEREMARVKRAQAIEPARQRRALVDAMGSGGGRAVRYGLTAMSELARGAGVDLSLESHVAKNVDLEQRAVDLANQGFMPGAAGANGKRQDPRALMDQARQVGLATATDPNEAMEGLQKFVAKTGDLQTGRDTIMDMARLAKATGASLADMADAAGDVSTNLGDVPNKAQVIKGVMFAIAGQGKEGAVEIKDLASQMAKLAAAAPHFTGDVAKNIETMGVLVQETRARGGAASSTQAATSVQSFLNTFSKHARRDSFKAAGIKLEGSDGKLRGAEDIIVDSLRATNGNTEKMGQLFMDVRARSVTKGFEAIFNEAGGGDAGVKAVRAEMERLHDATMSEEEVTKSLSLALGTTASKAAEFNVELGKITQALQDDMVSPLQSLGPILLQAAKDVVWWVDEITGKHREDKTKSDTTDDVVMANAESSLAALTRTYKAGESTAEAEGAAKENATALDEAIRKKEQVVKEHEAIFAQAPSLRRNQGMVDQLNQERADLANLKEHKRDLITALGFVKDAITDGFGRLKDSTLRVEWEDRSFMGPPAMHPHHGRAPANSPHK